MRVYLGEEKFASRFVDLLLEIGNGDYPSSDEMITIPENLCTVVTTAQDLISTNNVSNVSKYCSYS
jgi:hypothetical protein